MNKIKCFFKNIKDKKERLKYNQIKFIHLKLLDNKSISNFNLSSNYPTPIFYSNLNNKKILVKFEGYDILNSTHKIPSDTNSFFYIYPAIFYCKTYEEVKFFFDNGVTNIRGENLLFENDIFYYFCNNNEIKEKEKIKILNFLYEKNLFDKIPEKMKDYKIYFSYLKEQNPNSVNNLIIDLYLKKYGGFLQKTFNNSFFINSSSLKIIKLLSEHDHLIMPCPLYYKYQQTILIKNKNELDEIYTKYQFKHNNWNLLFKSVYLNDLETVKKLTTDVNVDFNILDKDLNNIFYYCQTEDMLDILLKKEYNFNLYNKNIYLFNNINCRHKLEKYDLLHNLKQNNIEKEKKIRLRY